MKAHTKLKSLTLKILLKDRAEAAMMQHGDPEDGLSDGGTLLLPQTHPEGSHHGGQTENPVSCHALGWWLFMGTGPALCLAKLIIFPSFMAWPARAEWSRTQTGSC